MEGALADVIVVTQCRAKGEVYVIRWCMEGRNMDQRLPSGSTVLVLSTKNATRFPKKRMENATVSSAGTFWRGIRAGKTQKHQLPPQFRWNTGTVRQLLRSDPRGFAWENSWKGRIGCAPVRHPGSSSESAPQWDLLCCWGPQPATAGTPRSQMWKGSSNPAILQYTKHTEELRNQFL